jgi:hypothetical protein
MSIGQDDGVYNSNSLSPIDPKEVDVSVLIIPLGHGGHVVVGQGGGEGQGSGDGQGEGIGQDSSDGAGHALGAGQALGAGHAGHAGHVIEGE